jgi:hypothetical protein
VLAPEDVLRVAAACHRRDLAPGDKHHQSDPLVLKLITLTHLQSMIWAYCTVFHLLHFATGFCRHGDDYQLLNARVL